ncbi:MAG: dephospho-CoA kinase [Firmicutes bacterium]|nr:dephospho-CoA kinase [Bacillota bacterium]
MKIFGLTGGSGTGKSTVSSLLLNRGIYVVDTDRLSRVVVKKGTQCLDELVHMFGGEILRDDGTLNRKKLGEIVFNDEEKLKVLNRITHHYIKYAIMGELRNCESEYAAIDGAVIIGSPVEELCDFIVTVDADYDIRLRRVIERDGISEEYARSRIDSQMSSEEYRAGAKYIIENNGTYEELERAVYDVCDQIKGIKDA